MFHHLHLSHNLKHLARRTMASKAAPVFNPFTLTLVQLGNVGSDKAVNLQHAREMVMKAAKSGSGMKPQVVVLPVGGQFSSPDISSYSLQECFNSPYGYVHFPTYAENIGYTPGKEYDVQASVSESVKMLSSAAKEAGVWLIGGQYFAQTRGNKWEVHISV